MPIQWKICSYCKANNNIPFKAVHINSKEEAQNAPTPITTYALFKDGKYVTNEQMNDTKFLKLHSILK